VVFTCAPFKKKEGARSFHAMAARLGLLLAILVVCASSSGCIFLGVYPYVQEVRGPIRGVRVRDAETGDDIPDAQVTFQSQVGSPQSSPTFYPLSKEELRYRNRGWFESEEDFIERSLTRGELHRDGDGVFAVPWRLKPGVGLIAVSFGDGPSYCGPFGDDALVQSTTITATAPGYEPMQLAYFSRSKETIGAFLRHHPAQCLIGNDGICEFRLARNQAESDPEAPAAPLLNARSPAGVGWAIDGGDPSR
jgi:hypothetical protein